MINFEGMDEIEMSEMDGEKVNRIMEENIRHKLEILKLLSPQAYEQLMAIMTASLKD